jgi:hypothetical protein
MGSANNVSITATKSHSGRGCTCSTHGSVSTKIAMHNNDGQVCGSGSGIFMHKSTNKEGTKKVIQERQKSFEFPVFNRKTSMYGIMYMCVI